MKTFYGWFYTKLHWNMAVYSKIILNYSIGVNLLAFYFSLQIGFYW